MKASITLISASGCFLPVLIFTNLFFGWMVFKPVAWLAIEAVLLGAFFFQSYLLARKIAALVKVRRDVIDVQGKVIAKETAHGNS